MKRLRLSKEDTKQLNEGWSVEVDKYIIFKTPAGWDWAVNPFEAEWYDNDTDELEDFAELDADKTEVADCDEDEEDDDSNSDDDEEDPYDDDDSYGGFHNDD